MRLDEVPDPELRPGFVKVQIAVVQPSVTEVLRFHGHAAPRSEEFRKLIEQGPPRQLFGHEASGLVVEVAPDVTSLKPGDPVAIFGTKFLCGQCPYCKAGLPGACVKPEHIGQEIPGCFAEYAALPAGCLVKLTPAVSYSEGAVIQSMTSCLRSVVAAEIQPGDTVAVLGQGAMGLGITQLAKAMGARQVIATARRASSLAMAESLGADATVNAVESDPVAAVRDLTGGIGVDIAFDAAGGSTSAGLSGYDTFFQATRMTRPGGKVVVSAGLVEPVTLPEGLRMLQATGIRLIFDAGVRRDMRAFMVDLVASERLRLKSMVTHRFEGIDSVPEAFAVTLDKRKHDAINPAQAVISPALVQ
jgi:threonine dehydrogenase-like Zn-dependent dehydrogenase